MSLEDDAFNLKRLFNTAFPSMQDYATQQYQSISRMHRSGKVANSDWSRRYNEMMLQAVRAEMQAAAYADQEVTIALEGNDILITGTIPDEVYTVSGIDFRHNKVTSILPQKEEE